MNGMRCAAQQARDDLAEAAEAGDEHLRLFVLGDRVERRAASAFGCAASQRDTAISSSGVSAIDRPTTATRRSRSAASISPALQRLAEHHEGEFAAEREHAAEQQRLAPVQPARDAARSRTAARTSPPSAAPRRPRSAPARPARAAGRSLMPTAMKNRPSSRPLNGSICASSSWRNSESASSTPARNAPRPIDQPGQLHQPRRAEHHQQRAWR